MRIPVLQGDCSAVTKGRAGLPTRGSSACFKAVGKEAGETQKVRENVGRGRFRGSREVKDIFLSEKGELGTETC